MRPNCAQFRTELNGFTDFGCAALAEYSENRVSRRWLDERQPILLTYSLRFCAPMHMCASVRQRDCVTVGLCMDVEEREKTSINGITYFKVRLSRTRTKHSHIHTE